jgi:hypothetical protein
MTSAELLVDAFGRIRQVVHRVVAGLTPEQLAFRAVCPASDDVSDIFQPTGSLLVTAVGRGAVADLRRQRQAAVAAAGAAVLVTTTARTRSASTTARRRQPSASWPRDVGVTEAARQYLVA